MSLSYVVSLDSQQPSHPGALPPDQSSAGHGDRTGPDSHDPKGLGPWRVFKRLTQFGFPRRFPIVQFPNAPLIVAFVAGEVAKHTHGSGHAYAMSISFLALVIWAYLELTDGVNWFRRLLGIGYSISTVVHLAMALHR
ncbi:MAG TPA: hypothetical protein VGG08_07585 [Solirubrobacteraceae bacterium]|jgi:hypothetical protein